MGTALWTRRHILSLADFSPSEYNIILETAAQFREVLSRRTKKVPALQGQVVTNLFFEPSTRTRSSFELAAKRLSADTLNFAPGTSSISKGETILDTAKTYLAMGSDLMVVRHQHAGVPLAIAQEMERLNTHVGVLNAGDGQHEHPSQALLDLFTICSVLNPDQPRIELIAGKKIAIVGDILHSRVARSNIWSLMAGGAEVHLAAPPTLLPKTFASYAQGIELSEWPSQGSDPAPTKQTEPTGDRPIPHSDSNNFPDHQQSANTPTKSEAIAPLAPQLRRLFLHWSLEPALANADFVMTLRLQKERMTQHLLPSLREYQQQFGLTGDRLAICSPQVKVLHPGPTNRGVEISSELMDDPTISLVPQQVTSGVAVRMALLYLMGTGGDRN